jgi:N-acetylglutamate synthase-like GNAT family acetyltransferase
MWIDALWVHPEHRHKGYGSAILDYLVDTCQYSRIKLFAANYSEQFYEQHNFERTLGRYYTREVNE